LAFNSIGKAFSIVPLLLLLLLLLLLPSNQLRELKRTFGITKAYSCASFTGNKKKLRHVVSWPKTKVVLSHSLTHLLFQILFTKQQEATRRDFD